MRLTDFSSRCLLTLVLVFLAACTGSDPSGKDAYTKSITYLGQQHVISGMVYGCQPRNLANVSAPSGTWPTYISLSSGQFAYVNYVSETHGTADEFFAALSDGTLLFSVWSGSQTLSADITVTEHRTADTISHFLSVSPQETVATVNISPVTNLAYWLWKFDNQHPFSDYRGSVFLFLKDQFPDYNLPAQNTVSDSPTPELLHLLDDVSISVANNHTGFTLSRKATGSLICTGAFATFPICQ